MKQIFLLLLAASAAFGQSADERGQLVFRLADKYEVWVLEEKAAAHIFRKYTYMISGNEAGVDRVYLCDSEKEANARMERFIAELGKTGEITARRFNCMDMRLLSAGNEAYADDALFFRYKSGSRTLWRVSFSSTLRVFRAEIDGFRRQYEFL
jgi:hypothetical protein